MLQPMKAVFVLGGLFLALAVMLGAFGAHALKNMVSDAALATWQTAVLYQFVHGLALLIVGLLMTQLKMPKALLATSCFFVLGMLLFSGSLYALVFTQWHWLGPITPLGGLCFIAGWLTFTWQMLRAPSTT